MKTIVVHGPAKSVVGGVATHLNELFASDLGLHFNLLYFQVGGEGRIENVFRKLARLSFGPIAFLIFLLRHRVGIAHLNTTMEPKSYWRDVAYLAVARIAGTKVVYQVHGGALPQEFFAGSRLLTAILRAVLRAAHVVVVLSQLEKRSYENFVPDVWREAIPNAIDASPFMSCPPESKPVGILHLVYLGRLAEYKGLFTAIDALSVLVSSGRAVRFTIAGSGPDEARIRARVMDLQLQQHVRFAGMLFGEAKNRLWCEGHIFVFPTWHREGLPYALLEAMAAGAVPVTTRIGGIPDIVDAEVHGLFVEARDPMGLAAAIARLDDDRPLLLRMAHAGRARVFEGYSINRLAADFRRLYENLAARS